MAATSAPPHQAILEQLQRLLRSQVLAGSDQLQRLLRLVVERSLNGQSDLLKEYNLGLEVFHRPPDYDPKIDPIVRVQARRLRAKLDEYYASEGRTDPVLIQIPKGAYVPSFEAHTPTPEVPVATPETTRHPLPQKRWLLPAGFFALLALAVFFLLRSNSHPAPSQDDINRSIAVFPMKMFSEGGNHAHIANQITEVLTTQLATHGDLRVLSRTTAETTVKAFPGSSLPQLAGKLNVRWVVEGGVGQEGNRSYLKLRLVDSRTDRKIWADVFDFESANLVSASTTIADRIAARLRTELSRPRLGQ